MIQIYIRLAKTSQVYQEKNSGTNSKRIHGSLWFFRLGNDGNKKTGKSLNPWNSQRPQPQKPHKATKSYQTPLETLKNKEERNTCICTHTHLLLITNLVAQAPQFHVLTRSPSKTAAFTIKTNLKGKTTALAHDTPPGKAKSSRKCCASQISPVSLPSIKTSLSGVRRPFTHHFLRYKKLRPPGTIKDKLRNQPPSLGPQGLRVIVVCSV